MTYQPHFHNCKQQRRKSAEVHVVLPCAAMCCHVLPCAMCHGCHVPRFRVLQAGQQGRDQALAELGLHLAMRQTASGSRLEEISDSSVALGASKLSPLRASSSSSKASPRRLTRAALRNGPNVPTKPWSTVVNCGHPWLPLVTSLVTALVIHSASLHGRHPMPEEGQAYGSIRADQAVNRHARVIVPPQQVW